MENKRTRIELALERLIREQQGNTFERLALQLAKQRWPDIEPTESGHDGGEDGIPVPSQYSDTQKRSLACSITGTLEKVRGDCRRIKERGVRIDLLIFYTPAKVNNLEISEWQKKIQQEFKHDLLVMPRATIVADLERPGTAWLCRDYLGLDFADESDIETLAIMGRNVAIASLQQWKAEYSYEPNQHISLTLRLESDNHTQQGRFLNLQEVCETARQARGLILKGVPGAGKTITLLQLAIAFINDSQAPIPIVISLPEWASKNQDFLNFLAEAPLSQAAGLSKTDWVQLNHAGRVIFLLNGWNEISTEVIQKASSDLRALVRNSPATAFVIATREGTLAPLLKPAIVQVEPLTPQQRRTIVARANLANPAEIIDIIEHQPALEQITRTPLFLTGVIELDRQGITIPTSRYGIMEALVGNAETHRDHAMALLHGPSRGCHRRYLTEMASTMGGTGVTSLKESAALGAIGKCSRSLQEQGLIGHVPNAYDLLGVLIAHHVLVKAGHTGAANIRFVHQQFQEWFAAQQLYMRLVETVENPHEDAVFSFQRDILDRVTWEEALKFLAERLNPMYGWEADARYGDALVRLAIPVDLIFAAELARFVGWETLTTARDKLSAALRVWYARPEESHQKCALAAMLATGSADFTDIVLPLSESDDQQTRLRAYRVWKPFPLTCLGEDWSHRIAHWPEERRAEFIREMMWDADAPHRQLAAHLAQEDSQDIVQEAALEMLAWSRDFETLMTILENETYTWPINQAFRFLEVLPKRYWSRLVPRIKAVLSSLTVPDARCTLVQILDEVSDQDAVRFMKEELDREPSSRTISALLPRIHNKEPEWVAEWLGKRMLDGDFWEEQWAAYLNGASSELLASLGKVAAESSLDLNIFTKRIYVLSKVAPDVVARRLLPEFIETRAERRRSPTPWNSTDRESRLHTVLRGLPYSALVHATSEIANLLMEPGNVATVLEILSPSSDQDIRSMLSPAECDQLRELIFTWDRDVPPLENDQGGRMAHLAVLLGATGKPEDMRVLERWLQAEFARVRTAPRTTRYTYSYARAFARLQCDEAAAVLLRLLSNPEYLGIASYELSQLALTEEETTQNQVAFGPDYRRVWHARRARAAQTGNHQGNPRRVAYAQAIHEALATRQAECQEPDGPPIFLHFDLAQAAKALAHLGEEECIPLLLQCGSHEALEILVLKGIMLPGAATFKVLDPIIAKVENKPFYFIMVRTIGMWRSDVCLYSSLVILRR